jgi:antitoxin PrlF
MLFRTTLTSKGQLTFPKELRDKLGIKQGDQITFEYANETIRVRIVPVMGLEELYSSLTPSGEKPITEEESKELYAKHRLARNRRSQ